MASKPKQEEQSKEDILRELYKDNASNESDDDDLVTPTEDTLHAADHVAEKKAEVQPTDPISEEQQRHKQNLMRDIYD